MISKIRNLELRKEAIRLLREISIPASIDTIATGLDVSWGTARALLLYLALDGEVGYLKTTKTMLFYLPGSPSLGHAQETAPKKKGVDNGRM